ncbi:MAG: isopenicillin-N epimerase [Chlamydiales bacterium]|jgi:isopenicillin-N epimerase
MPSPYRQHWQIDPQLTYLNHGSFGACPAPVLEFQSELRKRMESSLVRFMARELEAQLDEARAVLAEFVGAEPENVAFVPNATSGVNAVLRSMDLNAGDEILITDHGYNACNNAVNFVTERARARTVVAHLPFPIESPSQAIDAVLSKVTARTRLALIDHITSATGLILPISELIEALRERGVETLVDGAHAPGMLELDIERWNPAYYTGNCHKWPCAPKGAAFLWVRPELQASVRPSVISHGANSKRTDRSLFLQEFDWTGTSDPTAILSIPKALSFMGSLMDGGWPALREHNHRMLLAGAAKVQSALGVSPAAPDTMLGSLASIPLPEGGEAGPSSAFDVNPLQRRLFDEHAIEVPVMWSEAAGRNLIRISAQAYNDPSEYEKLAQVLGS